MLAPQQAVSSGMSAATVHRRVRTGLWERLYPTVYLVGGHRLTDEARVRAAWPGPVVGSAAARELWRRAQNEELRAPWRARRPEVARDLRCSCHKGRALVDGWAWHVDPERFRADRRKQNALVRDGWDPLRFTWHDLDQRPRSMADEIWSTVQGR